MLNNKLGKVLNNKGSQFFNLILYKKSVITVLHFPNDQSDSHFEIFQSNYISGKII